VGADPSGAAPTPAEKPRRIVLVVESLQVGGTETQATRLAAELAARGHQVKLVATQGSGPLEAAVRAAGITVEVFDLQRGQRGGPLNVAHSLLGLWGSIRRWHPDVVQTYAHWPGMLALPMAWVQRVPGRVAARRTLWEALPFRSRPVWWLHALSIRCATSVLANSRLVADDTVNGGGIPAAKVTVIENGLDLPDACADVGHQPPVGLMVAQMRPEKAHVDLVRALALVEDPPTIRLIGDGIERPAVIALAAELGVDGSLVLEGGRDDAGDAFADAQFGLLTSHNEGLPNAVLEAFSYGVPVIATAVGGVPDVVVDGVTGLLVPPRDAPALAAAVARLAADPPLRERLGAAARRRAEDFSWDRCVSQHEALYRTTGSRARGCGRAPATEV
jgi:glycosyltransferase involved in cell wall biosynthesis